MHVVKRRAIMLVSRGRKADGQSSRTPQAGSASSLFTPRDRNFAAKAAELVTTNPFHPSWMQKQRDLLGHAAEDPGEVYAWEPGWGLWGSPEVYPDLARLGDRIDALVEEARERLVGGAAASEAELGLYQTLALYRLYRTYGEEMDLAIEAATREAAAGEKARLPELKKLWDGFRGDQEELFAARGFPVRLPPEHVFASFFVLRRAFYHIFCNIVGFSKPVVQLRSAIWLSIVTHDLLGWARSLYARMQDFPTLITGPSGTGKELVAQAIGRSLYIPFDPERKEFAVDFLAAFQPVNLSALPPALIESELFGHARGSFSFAVRDRVGRLEECPEYGAVFLDEIGELTAEIQVKLLRMLQTRRFQRVGENDDRLFAGKVLAATNRDLAAEMHAGRFREDFYYRLCADRIETPSLHEQLSDRPEDLEVMVRFLCRRVVGVEEEERWSREVVDWIEEHLGGYTWPGNFRELEQCVRSYTIRKEYHPLRPAAGKGPADGVADACAMLADAVRSEALPYDEIERRLFQLVYEQAGSYQEAARLLQRDWRTLRARLA
jgi:transcriptional regulator with AAA-type ATPase domain